MRRSASSSSSTYPQPLFLLLLLLLLFRRNPVPTGRIVCDAFSMQRTSSPSLISNFQRQPPPSSLLLSSVCMRMTKHSTTNTNDRETFLEELDPWIENPTITLPKLIVFDLDNTIWTPELYQIRKQQYPKPHQDIHLFPSVPHILQWLNNNKHSPSNNNTVQLAIASRTSKIKWAQQLLKDFQIQHFFQHIEIYTGSKKQHFQKLHESTRVPFHEMLFFDDDARMNLPEISRLGVLCCHTPRGITGKHFVGALRKYAELRNMSAGKANELLPTTHPWMGYILHSPTLGCTEDDDDDDASTQVTRTGSVKFYSTGKKFGFLVADGQEYFVHESKLPYGTTLRKGDQVRFQATQDSKGRLSATVLSASPGDDSTSAQSSVHIITMKCFTMSQPFAALLLNGVKTVESRNSNMFQSLKPGTKLLLHVGKKDWHDTDSFREILGRDGMKVERIDQLSRLPKGFSKGEIAGIITVGKTWDATGEKSSVDLQRKVLAPPDGIGRYCTEVRDFRWLKRPFKIRGQPGIYDIDIPSSMVSDATQS